ncbi:MAG: dihydroorotase [Eubacterium sp.]|nr:dihydroorotase [Candidatus Colimonas fimequi]
MTNKRLFIRLEELTEAQGERLASLGIDVSLFNGCYILPGFTDVHVHLREPGFLYKETIATGTLAAAAGGFTDILSMPNLNPVPDSVEHLQVQLDAIVKDAVVHTYPYGSITVGEMGEELADLEGMAENAVAFTDDGKGVMSDEFMKEAMIRSKELGKLIVAHCEDENYPRESPEAEFMQLERDLNLVRETGCPYHMCHVSTWQSMQLIRTAKEEGLDVTVETAPHYLVHSKKTIEDHGRFKMNPPIKDEADRLALIEAIKDGTIDMIATDHAPHSAEEKEGGFAKAAFGIVGLETCFPIMYKYIVEEEIITLDKLIEMMYVNPRERFGFEAPSIDAILDSEFCNFAIWNLDEEYTVDPEEFKTMGRSTPFEGMDVKGRCLMTVVDGEIVYKR